MPGDGSPPLTPDGGTAHSWLQRELSKPAYADQRNLVQRLWDWATDALHDLLSGVGSALPLTVLIPLLLVVVAIVVFAATRVQGHRRTPGPAPGKGVLADVALTAEQLRERAARSSADGRHSAAFIDFFRAIARRGEERALLVPSPGRTAHEVGAELASYFPGQGAQVQASAHHFDAIRYGGVDATAADVDRIRALDHSIETARPQHTGATL